MSPLGTTWRCDQCRKQVRGTKHTTTLGRTICTACQGRHDAMVLGGLMAQQQDGAFVTNAVGDSIAVAGARSWFRRAVGRDATALWRQKHSGTTESTPGAVVAGRDD